MLPSGHEVRPGDFILLSSWAMGRNPRVWADPDAFDPDRFTDENLRANAERLARESAGADADEATIAMQMERMSRRIAGGRDFTYTPFGSGPRSCIGGTFALLATTVNLASMVQRFEFSVDPEKDPGFELPFFYDTTITFPSSARPGDAAAESAGRGARRGGAGGAAGGGGGAVGGVAVGGHRGYFRM